MIAACSVTKKSTVITLTRKKIGQKEETDMSETAEPGMLSNTMTKLIRGEVAGLETPP